MVNQAAARGGSIEQPERRVVLLGASNLMRGIATVVETACRAWGRPLDVLIAAGHGRSYGMRSRVLVRELPGITECALWPALAARPVAPTAALITDIGNDLFYGSSPDAIARWVEQCCQRLKASDARLVMTRLPVCNVGRVRPWQYRAFRTMFFPACRLSLADLTHRAQELDERLLELAGRFACRLIEPQACWYGLDPIHVKLMQARSAWQEVFAGWGDVATDPAPRASVLRWMYLYSCSPEQRWLLGRKRTHLQPCGRLPDGTVLSFY
jgi:hypothetical protein